MAPKIPQYASRHPVDQLAQYFCKTCSKMRLGRVSRSGWTTDGSNLDRELYVICLKCGNRQYDNYNWLPL
ncbi:hypothetical protein SAMN05216178_2252 [Pseudomonas saponiphila]|uniref:Uncharacterized protein n=1 Tax=Pseudomonas saponiphila TaxID=556534 RepID=A0A1H4M6B5_9PSED|nr:hypothetical protein [Pseudomonas saponiphila]SEB78611.1 hypothetical protein SAMN05216178_2252 [Pseudomonas saponiphila]